MSTGNLPESILSYTPLHPSTYSLRYFGEPQEVDSISIYSTAWAVATDYFEDINEER